MQLKDFVFEKSVYEALRARRPVVALESTIITHGLPYPHNVTVAHEVESIIKAAGATPATIAVMDGKIRIGLTAEQIETLATAENVKKLSRDNLSVALVLGDYGSTTVAATMWCAHRAGISIFATGGIGGVHRGADKTFDISADLRELSQTPVTVISAGVKTVLDPVRTLEYLETHGVPVIGLESDELAGFWSRSSGVALQSRLETPRQIAQVICTRQRLGETGGVLISNPVPVEYEIPRAEMERHIIQALQQAEENGITGKAVTPFLLKEVVRLTGGRSVDTNKEVIKHNARLAAEIAVSYNELTPRVTWHSFSRLGLSRPPRRAPLAAAA